VVAWGPNRLDIFGLGTDNQMFHKYWDGHAWGPSPTGWEALGGEFNSPPAVVAWGPNRLDIFGLGTDNQMFHKYFNGAWGPSPTGWEALGGEFDSPPAVVAWGRNRLDIFGLGTDNQMFHKYFNGAWGPSPTGWEALGGEFNSAPAAVAWGPNRLDIFGLGTDNQMFHKYFNGAWGPSPTGWEALGGRFNIPGQLSHAPSTQKWHADVTFSDDTPLGGWVEFVADNSGSFTFSGHMHDSGFDPISFTIAVAIVTPPGLAYGFGFSGRCGGTISGGSRDCDWMGSPTSTFKDQNGNVIPNPNPNIASNWGQFAQAQMSWRITAQDLTAGGVLDFVTQAVEDMAKQVVAAGTAALIALL
jgi:hypothetical protein